MSGSTEWVPALWTEVFNSLLDDESSELDYGDEWNLNFNYRQTDEVTPQERKKGWKVFCSTTMGRFKCASCSNSWTSARVRVLFRYRLLRERGTVIMRPFGQACRSCNNSTYRLCGFTENDVKEALLKLFSKIRKNCYQEEDDGYGVDNGGRSHRWTKPHESDLCEACSEGICTQNEECV